MLSSHAHTSAPLAISALALAMPLLPRPMTATGKPAKGNTSITRSPQLERREAGERQDRRDDPEADEDGRLLPALLLEVVMERRHAKDAFAGELEGEHLHEDRHGLEHEEPAYDRKHELVLGDDADGAERAPA